MNVVKEVRKMKGLTGYGTGLVVFGVVVFMFPVVLAALVAAFLIVTGIFLIRAGREIRSFNRNYMNVFDEMDDVFRHIHVRRW